MSRIMIVVEFELKPEHKNYFVSLMKEHARLSRAEHGCQQFDVPLPVDGQTRFSSSRRGGTRRRSMYTRKCRA